MLNGISHMEKMLENISDENVENSPTKIPPILINESNI